MKQIVQPISGGPVELLDVLRPVPEPTEVLVRTISSVISAGTERAIRLARLVGADGEVIAIEPDPDVVRRTNRNIALNGVANVRVISATASERASETRLFRPSPRDTNRARASLLHHPYLTGVTTTVPMVTVDDVCAGEPVSLIKIDVGGHEAAVARGAADTIAGYAPSVVFEYAPELLDDVVAQTPFGWLAERGYEIFRIRAARHGITGRVRLALDRLQERPRRAVTSWPSPTRPPRASARWRVRRLL